MDKAHLFQDAISLDRSGRSREAADALRMILREDPKYFKAASLLGQIAVKEGNWPEAWDCLIHLDSVGPDSQALKSLMGAMNVERVAKNPHRRPVPKDFFEAVVVAREMSAGPYMDQMNVRRDLKLRLRKVRHGFLAETIQVQFSGRTMSGDPSVGDSVALPITPTNRRDEPPAMQNLETGEWLAVDDRPDILHANTRSSIRSQRIIFAVFATLLLVGAGWLAYDSWIYPNLKAIVPVVAGQDSVNAELTLRGAGFPHVQTRRVQDPNANGEAVGTDPPAGSSAAHNSTIFILLGDPVGPPGSTVVIPDVTGLTWGTAVARLQNARISNVEVEGDEFGVVLRTEPAAGSNVRPSRPGDSGDIVVLVMEPR